MTTAMMAARPADAAHGSAYPRHAESRGIVRAPTERVFAYLDGHARLAAHMARPSWRMGWGRMAVRADAQEGRAVGSRLRLEGRVLGVRLWVDEEVTERVPPHRKTWATVGAPRLLVIGPYRMGFALDQRQPDDGVTVTVFLDYALPDRGVAWLLGRAFGRWYARWCTQQMIADACAAFPVVPRTAA